MPKQAMLVDSPQYGFCTPPPGCYIGKMLSANASKIKTNWFLTLQPAIF